MGSKKKILLGKILVIRASQRKNETFEQYTKFFYKGQAIRDSSQIFSKHKGQRLVFFKN